MTSVACWVDIIIHQSAQGIAVTLNRVDDTFVGQAADVSVDQTITILANIYLLHYGDAMDIRIFRTMLQHFSRIWSVADVKCNAWQL